MAAGEFLRLYRRPLIRTVLATAALAATLGLAGCNTDGTQMMPGRAMAPLSDKMVAELESKSMDKASPILVRLFKSEAELEVWKQDRSGQFALLKTYPICRWSGDLGPKVKEGDRQAPEGFYTITPAQMNPNSSYYLAFNMGFPNAYDKANGRTGSNLMIHGDCSSRGCYAMTDEQISEIYALGRESFFGGQKAFQVQAYPFRMTPENMAKHRNSKHMAFWKMIKEGYDHFEVTRQQPQVSVCERRYVFDATATNGTFNPSAKCPTYEIPAAIAQAVQEKQRRDEYQTAQLISHGVPLAPNRAGIDGGMNTVFAEKLGLGNSDTVQDQSGRSIMLSSASNNGGIFSRVGVVPPAPLPPETPAPAAAPAPKATAVAAAPPAPAKKVEHPARFANTLNTMYRTASADAKDAPALRGSSADERKDTAKTAHKDAPRDDIAAKLAEKPLPAPAPSTQTAQANKPRVLDEAPSTRSAYASPPPAMSGAQAVLPATSFNSRWSAFR